jgi:hypothetical protein
VPAQEQHLRRRRARLRPPSGRLAHAEGVVTRVVNLRHQQWFPDDPRCVYIGHFDNWRRLASSPWRNIFAAPYHDTVGELAAVSGWAGAIQ